MDNITWKRNLRSRRRRSGCLFTVLLLIVIIGAAFAGWYYFFYMRTPEFALKQMQQAIEQDDPDAFARYVNLDIVTSRAYDDLTADLFRYDTSLTDTQRTSYQKFYTLVKPQLTGGTIDVIKDRIETGRWISPSGTNILQGHQLGIDYERFLERSQLRNTTLVRIGATERKGSSAVVDIDVIEDYTQTPFTLQVVMEQDINDRWQIVYIRNYKDYLDTVAPLQNKDIASYIAATQPVVDRYNGVFAAQQSRFKQLTKTRDGYFSDAQREAIAALLTNEVIPTLQTYQQELDTIEVPVGAQYLARQRQQSTETTIKAWQHFITGIRENRQSEFDTAATFQKQERAIDIRISDIIRHTAVSRDIPNIP